MNIERVVLQESAILVGVQRRLHEAGLHESAAAINAAVNKLGLEAARLLECRAALDALKGTP